MVGTKRYMSPEQWRSEDTTAQTDLYALGIIAYELLTGHLPFEGATHEALREQHLNKPLPADLHLTPAVMAVLARMTAKTPDQRYPSGAAFVKALRSACLDNASPDTLIATYFEKWIAEAYQVLHEQYVELQGDRQTLIAPEPPLPRSRLLFGLDPLAELGITLDFGQVRLNADYQHRESEPGKAVTSVRERLLQIDRGRPVGRAGDGQNVDIAASGTRLRRHLAAQVGRSGATPAAADPGAGAPEPIQGRYGQSAPDLRRVRAQFIGCACALYRSASARPAPGAAVRRAQRDAAPVAGGWARSGG